MNLLSVKLKQFQNTGDLIAIYTNPNDVDKFTVGKVLEVFEDSLFTLTLNIDSSPDAIMLIFSNFIYQIETNNSYLNNMKNITHDDIPSCCHEISEIVKDAKESLPIILNFSKETGRKITISHYYEFDLDCIIEEYDEEFIYGREVENDGSPGGKVLLRKEHILRIILQEF